MINIMNEYINIEIPDKSDSEQPFSIKVFSKEININGTDGAYRFVAGFEHNAEAAGGDIVFYIADKSNMPEVSGEIILWGDDGELGGWLSRNNISWLRIEDAEPGKQYAILVSGKAPEGRDKKQAFDELNKQIANGSTAVYLTPEILTDENADKNTARELIWGAFDDGVRPSLDTTWSWYFRCDHWAKKHDLLAGLHSGGIFDYRLYQNILKHIVISGLSEPFEAVAGALQLSGPESARFSSDTLLTIHQYKKGRFILNTLNIRENIGKDPVAEHLLRNFINYAQNNKEV